MRSNMAIRILNNSMGMDQHPELGSWTRLHDQRVRLLIVMSALSCLTLVLFLYLSWKNLQSDGSFPSSTDETILLVLTFITALGALAVAWVLSDREFDGLELFLHEARRHLGGNFTLDSLPKARRFRGLTIEPVFTREHWWSNMDRTWGGTLRFATGELEVIRHETRLFMAYLELKFRIPRDGFPVMWLWFHPPFKMGVPVGTAFVESKPGAMNIRPYMELLKSLKERFGFKNLRFDKGSLEVRFNPYKGTPQDLPTILDIIRRVGA